jgi:hypothetical protein
LNLRQLRIQFKDTMPVSDGFFKLMQQTFGFYTSLCNDFFTNLGGHVESNTLSTYLQTEIRPRLFDSDHCKDIEEIKKQFLSENIKLEQFVEQNHWNKDFINDFKQLKKVSEAIYELLQTHWEFFKYEKTVASNEAIIAFILEIDRIGIRWDAYLEKYLAISGVLKAAMGETLKESFTSLNLQYHLPEDASFTLEMCTSLIGFLQSSYEFVLKVHDKTNDASGLEITNLNVGNPVYCELLVPSEFVQSFSKFLGYLSVDVLKRETLVKFVMEIVRLQQGKEIPKTAIANFQKKIAKALNQLHPEGYFSIGKDEAEDSVELLSSMCGELDRLKVEYKDLLTGSTNRLARNRQKPLSQLSVIAKKTPVLEKSGKSTPETKVPAPPTQETSTRPALGTKVPEPPTDDSGKKTKEPSKQESTVKINVKNKEHIQYLTT